MVAATPIGQTATIQVLRDGKSAILTARIAKLPEPPQRAETASPTQEQLGLSVRSLTPALAKELGVPDTDGVVVTDVKDGSPAAESGIEPGDVIVAANRRPVKSIADLRQGLTARAPGEPALLQIHRKDASLFVAVPAQG